jgi:hypothetical protein
VHGASGDQIAPEANEEPAAGSGHDAPGEQLVLGAGTEAAAEAAKDLQVVC